MMAKKAINRLKIVLAEQRRTNKWLAEKLDKNTATISRWCTNEMQPSLESLVEISETLNVDVRMLLVSTESKIQID
jgi:transcriptional regulator with XRE-family HTH domain